jgi:outer membrane protein
MVTKPSYIAAVSVACGLLGLTGTWLPAAAAPSPPESPPAGESPAPEAPAPASPAAPPSAQTEPDARTLAVPEKLSLKESLTLALTHNQGYKQSLVSVANSESRLRAANQLRHASLDADLAFSRHSQDGSSTFSAFGPALSLSRPSGASLTGSVDVPGYNSPRTGGEAGLQYSMPLIRGRGRGSEVRAQLVQARIDTDRTYLSHFDGEQGLIEEVVQAYFNAIRAQDLLRIQEEAVRIAKQVTSDTKKRLDAGLIIEIDVTRAQLQLSSTQERLLSQQQAYKNAIDTLVLILGLPVGAQPQLTDTISYNYTPIDEATAVQTALERRPELSQIRLQQADAEVQVALAQTRKKPRADVRFNLASLGFTLFGGGGITNILTSLLGLNVSVPVREKPLQEAVMQAERNRAILDDEYEFRRQTIVNDVRRLVRSAENAKSNIDLLTQNLEVAKKSQHIAQRLVEEGLRDNRDLLEAQSSITSTEGGVLSAKVDYFLTVVNLQRAMGLPLRSYFSLPESAVIRDQRTAYRGEASRSRGRRTAARPSRG